MFPHVWNSYFFFLLFKNMNSIDRILNFINSEEEQEPETETTTEQQETTTEQEQATPSIETKQATPSIETEQEQQAPKTVEYNDEKTYKSILRKANNTIKKNQYPAVISINGKNQVFTSGDDLKLFVNNIKTEHKENNKKRLNDKINNYKHFNEEYTQEIGRAHV